jgi:hypothetical protein
MTERLIKITDELRDRIERSVGILEIDDREIVAEKVFNRIETYLTWYGELIWPYQLVLHQGRIGDIEVPSEELQILSDHVNNYNKQFGFVAPVDHTVQPQDLALVVWNNVSRPIHGDVMGPSRIDLVEITRLAPFEYPLGHPMSYIDVLLVRLASLQDPFAGLIIEKGTVYERPQSTSIMASERIILPID